MVAALSMISGFFVRLLSVWARNVVFMEEISDEEERELMLWTLTDLKSTFSQDRWNYDYYRIGVSHSVMLK